MFNFMNFECPWCGCLQDDGAWIQFEDKPTVFVCHDCYDAYLDDLDGVCEEAPF